MGGASHPTPLREHIYWIYRDRASSHRGKQVAQLPFKQVYQPPYSPELNPVERIFEELRQEVEGWIYSSLRAKQQAVERVLYQLAADPERVKRLAGWQWICDALDSLPPEDDPALVKGQVQFS